MSLILIDRKRYHFIPFCLIITQEEKNLHERNMIIKESEIREIIKSEILKKASSTRFKNLVKEASERAGSRLRLYGNSKEVISEIYGDPSYSGTAVAYSGSPYDQPDGGGTQQARASDPPAEEATQAAPAKRRSGTRYKSSAGFPLKRGDKDASGSTKIKDMQEKVGLKGDGFFGPKTEKKIQDLHGVKVVSEDLYNRIMGTGGSVDVTTGPEGGDQQLGTGGSPRQVTRQASGGKYRIKKKKSGTIKIDPTGGMEKTIKNAVVRYMTQQDPANEKQHKKIRVGRILIDLRNPDVDEFGEEEFMSANVRLKGDLGRLAAIGRGREASSVVKKAVWRGLKAAGILEV